MRYWVFPTFRLLTGHYETTYQPDIGDGMLGSYRYHFGPRELGGLWISGIPASEKHWRAAPPILMLYCFFGYKFRDKKS